MPVKLSATLFSLSRLHSVTPTPSAVPLLPLITHAILPPSHPAPPETSETATELPGTSCGRWPCNRDTCISSSNQGSQHQQSHQPASNTAQQAMQQARHGIQNIQKRHSQSNTCPSPHLGAPTGLSSPSPSHSSASQAQPAEQTDGSSRQAKPGMRRQAWDHACGPQPHTHTNVSCC